MVMKKMKSPKESSFAPIVVSNPFFRAINPSRKSVIPQKAITTTNAVLLFAITGIINESNILKIDIMFGILLFKRMLNISC